MTAAPHAVLDYHYVRHPDVSKPHHNASGLPCHQQVRGGRASDLMTQHRGVVDAFRTRLSHLRGKLC